MKQDECTHDCSTCGKNCGERKADFDFSAKLNAGSKVARVIAVASGKGGVGKSFVTTMLAVAAMRQGKKVGILDADITGPSIPKAFGLSGSTYKGEEGIEPIFGDRPRISWCFERIRANFGRIPHAIYTIPDQSKT